MEDLKGLRQEMKQALAEFSPELARKAINKLDNFYSRVLEYRIREKMFVPENEIEMMQFASYTSKFVNGILSKKEHDCNRIFATIIAMGICFQVKLEERGIEIKA